MRQLGIALIIVFNSNTLQDMIFIALLCNLLFSLMKILGQVDPQMLELYTRISS